jgi:hypothetical protein
MYWSGTSEGIAQHDTVIIVHPEIQIQYVFLAP